MDTYIAFAIHKAKDFDLDMRGLGIGAGRSSKSTKVAGFIRKCILFDEISNGARSLGDIDIKLVVEKWVENYVLYKDRMGMIATYKTKYGFHVVGDDSLLMGDNRRQMETMEVLLTQAMESYADSNATTWLNCQNITLLDPRFIDGSNFVFVTDVRGHLYFFAKEKNLPLIKRTFGFERFQKHPSLLNDSGLKTLRSFICDYDFEDLEDNLFWKSWKENKKLHKNT